MAAAESGVENPLAGAESTDTQIDIRAGLKDGTLTSDEAIVQMEEQMERMRTEMQKQMQVQKQEQARGRTNEYPPNLVGAQEVPGDKAEKIVVSDRVVDSPCADECAVRQLKKQKELLWKKASRLERDLGRHATVNLKQQQASLQRRTAVSRASRCTGYHVVRQITLCGACM